MFTRQRLRRTLQLPLQLLRRLAHIFTKRQPQPQQNSSQPYNPRRALPRRALLNQDIFTRAENGDLDAQFEVAEMLRSGDGIEADLQAAIEMHRKAAKRGHVGSQVALSYILVGRQIADKRPNEAFKWAIAAAKQHNCSAQFNAAICLYSGSGCQRSYRRARQLFESSIINGMGDGSPQYYLGIIYRDGLEVSKDLVVARDYFEEAHYYGYPCLKELKQLKERLPAGKATPATERRPPPAAPGESPAAAPRPKAPPRSETLFACPSCEQRLRIAHPAPNGHGRCTSCDTHFRLITDEEGNLTTFIDAMQAYNERAANDGRNNTLLIKNCFTILELPLGASYSEAKNAYRRLISTNHPDKVDTHSVEVRESAAIKTKQLNYAMKILKERFYHV
ncbi:MAG: J domain-containing protein [Gammaproteobacteria bacterium]|nr:J domain-containing protein [Gammaproteobacteria bacterium]